MSAEEVQRLMSEADQQEDLKNQLLDNAHAFLRGLGFNLTREEAVVALVGTPQDAEGLGVDPVHAAYSNVCCDRELKYNVAPIRW